MFIGNSLIANLSVSGSAAPSTPAGGNAASRPAIKIITIIAGIVGAGLFLCAVLLCVRCILPRKAPIRQFVIGRARGRGELGSHASPDQLKSNGEGNEVSIIRLEQPIVQMKSTETGLLAIPRTAPTSLLSGKARLAQQLEGEVNVQPVARPAIFVSQDIPIQQPIIGVTDTLESSAQRMSTVLEEVQNLRTHVHELMRHQQLEASHNFPSTSSDVDAGRIAPPSYSEAEAC